jgi:predicted nuclease of restriction endonuclease-like RecB superfamily
VTSKEAHQLYANQGRKAPASLAADPCFPLVDRPHKYGARKKEVDGHMFDSTAEALAYQVLKRWEQAGEISSLELQPRFVIVEASRDAQGRKVRAREYRADFRFIRDGRSVVVDVKGFPTPIFLLKKRMFEMQYPGLKLEIWTRKTIKDLGA